MEMRDFQMYNCPRPKLGDEAAQEMITFVKSTIKTEMMDLTKIFLTKDDKFEIIRTLKDDKVEIMRTMKEDKVEVMRAVYMTSLFNFLAIACTVIGVVIAMLNYLSKN